VTLVATTYIDPVAKRQVVIEIVVAAGAIAAFGVGLHFGSTAETHAVPTGTQTAADVAQSNHLHRLIAYIAAGAWLLLASYSVRQLANHLGRAIALADKATAASVRLILTIVGLLFVVLMALAILRIGVSQLLLGGAITGVVLGIAAQQSLGNVFAGIVLLVARPFRAGDLVRVRTGSLGGPLEGHVVSMGLIYVVFTTEEGTTLVPNLTLLASGIVRSPRPLPAQAPLVVVGAPLEAVHTEGVLVATAPSTAGTAVTSNAPPPGQTGTEDAATRSAAGETPAGQTPAGQTPASQTPAGQT
jgi:small-conductance mechanosensitive channel